ncbi:hypothetical protein V1289_010017 [Bradyrhizobium sp. AZCC 2289]
MFSEWLNWGLEGLQDRSHLKNPGIPRLDLFALRLHCGGIGLEQFQIGQRNVRPLLLHPAWNERWAKTSTSICWVSAWKKKLWNSFAAFGLGALRKIPEGTMIRGEPSAA